jgi:hypothetical protein
MNTPLKLSVAIGVVVIACLAWNAPAQKPSAPSKPKLAVSIKPQHVADALRAVILSDREVYTQLLAEQPPAGSVKIAKSSTLPSEAKGLPSPCEVLRLGSQTVASKGVEYSYVLRSLQPVNPRNAPETEVETKGLQFLATRPDLSYSSEELLGGRWYFTAVYPDVALNQSCVNCHNRHPARGDRDYKLGDVLGALVVRIALEL